MSGSPRPTALHPSDVRGQGTVEHRTFSEADVEAIAAALAPRVAALLAVIPDSSPEPLAWTTADVARELRRSEEWVRDHRDELGLIASPGRRPRLLFDPDAVRSWATARSSRETSQTRNRPPALADRPRTARRAGTGTPLLPIGRAEEAA